MRYRLRTLLILLAIGPPVLAGGWGVWQRLHVGAESATQTDAEVISEFAKRQGWLDEYSRGNAILRELSQLSPERIRNLSIGAYRGEKIAIYGGAAPPGGTNDLITEGGFYVRVVNASGMDLRPHSVSWSVLVHGEVCQVLAENKIIVIEVKDAEWMVLYTF